MRLNAEHGPGDEAKARRSILSNHPRLGILLIAGVFYLLLCVMVATVLALIFVGDV